MSVKEVETPVAATSVHDRKKPVVKPDQATYDKALKEAKERIDVLQKKLVRRRKCFLSAGFCTHSSYLQQADAQGKISAAGGSSKEGPSDGRKELFAQQDELTKERNELSDKRGKLFEQLKTLQANLKKKSDATKTSTDRLGYKSVEDVEKQISSLERQQRSGEASLPEEKRIVAEISNLKKAKKILEGLAGQQSTVEDDKDQIKELRAQVDALNPARGAVNAKIDAVKAQITVLKDQQKERQGSVQELWTARHAVKAELDAEWESLRAQQREHRKLTDEFYSWQREEQARKREQYEAEARQQREERLAVQAARELENAEIPAYADEINQCASLIRFLEGTSASTDSGKATPVAAPATPTAVRKIEGLPEGTVLVKKDQEDFMVMGGKKGGKKGGKRQGSAAPKAFKLDFDIIDQFVKMKVELPTSAADVPTTIATLREKKAWYENNQLAATQKAKAVAEAKIAALRKASSATPVVASDAAVEETVTV
ncbi:hypothetical protein HKX48_001032 [Thoreauomyces humboldtii]|nr:hypothetical protein HKX48_001032 [Thoreauomyces humboldtii]